jgi:hypothetical protein
MMLHKVIYHTAGVVIKNLRRQECAGAKTALKNGCGGLKR